MFRTFCLPGAVRGDAIRAASGCGTIRRSYRWFAHPAKIVLAAGQIEPIFEHEFCHRFVTIARAPLSSGDIGPLMRLMSWNVSDETEDDLRNLGAGGSGRLRPDGTIVPRNSFHQDPLHRVGLRPPLRARGRQQPGRHRRAVQRIQPRECRLVHGTGEQPGMAGRAESGRRLSATLRAAWFAPCVLRPAKRRR